MKRHIKYPFILFLLLGSTISFATNYYVDADLGNDNNTGLTPLEAWQSLSKVNGFAFVPGDVILFKKTCTWNGMLSIDYSGTSTSPITYSAYGIGEKPTIHGQGLVDAAIFIRGSTSYITIDGFAVTNFDGQDVFDGAEGIRSGIHTGEWSAQQFGIKILNNEVYFVEGCSNHTDVGSPRGTNLDPNDYNQYQNAGIFCHASKIDDFVIQGNYVHDCSCTGINAFLFEEATNLLIRQNSVYNVGSDGIVILNGKSPIVELNACIDAGNNSGTSAPGPGVLGFNGLAVAGIWSHCSDSPLFQYNYCEGTKRIVWDGQPWDFDILTTGNAIYQYNFSRDNEGGFNLGGLPHQSFRYNISYNDGAATGGGQFFFNGEPSFYNNIFYRDDGGGFMMSDFEIQDFKNNIFYTTASTDITYEGDSRTFDNNCYYGHVPTNPGNNPILSNPLFIDEVTPGKILPGVIFNKEDLLKITFGYQIHSSSPCVDAGQSITDNGGQDFWGTSLYNNMADIGANEYQPTPVKTNFCLATQAPIIDGMDELFWQTITTHSLDQHVLGKSDNAADLQASFKASWDTSNFYFLITVQDDVLINDSANEPWSDDAIELFIDGNNEKSLNYDTNDYQFIVRWDDPNIYEFRSTVLQNTNPLGIQKSAILTPDGYQVELAISLSAFGLSASPMQQFGFDLHINDDDDGGGRDTKIAWHATVDLSARIPFTFATIELAPTDCCPIGQNCAGVPVTLDICAFLEGTYDYNNGLMTNDLEMLNLLPIAQPYNQAPWNYSGTETLTNSNIVDWMLVSFRTSPAKEDEIVQIAGLLQTDGCIYFPEQNLRTSDLNTPVYIVVEHRNHMGIMSPQPVPLFNDTLTYDFRADDSYNAGGGIGQKQLTSGTWGMVVGDMDQTDPGGYDINGSDKAIWQVDNGLFNVYLPTDLNQDGDVNGAENVLWSYNNGTFSSVPK